MTDPAIERRDFTRQTIGSLLTFSLLETLTGNDLLADEVKPIATKWVADLNQLCKDVKGRKLKQTEWQTAIEGLFKKVDLPELLKLVRFDKLSKRVKWKANGAHSTHFKFPQVEGIPNDIVFGRQIFALKKDRSVVPHGHNNMATAFLVLKGDFHGRHYDRIEDAKDHMIIKPTIDRKFKPTEYSTVSDDKDNIHWFKSLGDGGFIFNIHVLNINPKLGKPTGRVYVDPNGEKLKDGLVRAKRINGGQAHKLYG